jgi:hypothetical protein
MRRIDRILDVSGEKYHGSFSLDRQSGFFYSFLPKMRDLSSPPLAADFLAKSRKRIYCHSCPGVLTRKGANH